MSLSDGHRAAAQARKREDDWEEEERERGPKGDRNWAPPVEPPSSSMKLTGTILNVESSRCSADGEHLDGATATPPQADAAATASPSPPGEARTRCSICADRATGKHYGASSCDGCKGFFRRSVRNSHTYNCRFNGQCVVDKDKRNQCRYCRLQKCFKAGMKKGGEHEPKLGVRGARGAVSPSLWAADSSSSVSVSQDRRTLWSQRLAIFFQNTFAAENERDCVNSQRARGPPTAGTLSIGALLRAEAGVQQFPALRSPSRDDGGARRTACVGDVFESMKHQLLLLVEWAKHIPEFCSLSVDDRVTLLRSRSAEQLVLGAARRSVPYSSVILLGNNFVIPLRGAEMEVTRVAIRVQEELVKPLRELEVTDEEFACLRTIVFFAPDCPGLESPRAVRQLRLQAHLLLEEAACERRGRFGELLLVLPPLQSVAWQLVETLHLAQLLGEARMDSLLQEMLLGEGGAAEQRLRAGDSFQAQQRVSPENFASVVSHVSTPLPHSFPAGHADWH